MLILFYCISQKSTDLQTSKEITKVEGKVQNTDHGSKIIYHKGGNKRKKAYSEKTFTTTGIQSYEHS